MIPTASIGRDGDLLGSLAGDREQGRRGPLAQAQAGAPQPGRQAVGGRLAPAGPIDRAEVRADLLRAGQPAGDVVADVGDDRGALAGR